MIALADALRAIADEIIASEDELNRLDGAAGDGDLGITMTAAAKAMKVGLADVDEPESTAMTLKRCGVEIARKAPSTAGTLLAGAFLRVGASAADDALMATGPLNALAVLLRDAQAAIEQRGGARPGDKTMLDALAPAVTSLSSSASTGVPIPDALDRAAAAASKGAASTRTMRARVGRAGWLAERSQGHVDAGAHLVALVFAAAARSIHAAPTQAAARSVQVGASELMSTPEAARRADGTRRPASSRRRSD